jgi:arginase family enzyme
MMGLIIADRGVMMQTITLEVPDELAERLKFHRDKIALILQIGLREVEVTKPLKLETPRERGIRVLRERGVASPLDESIVNKHIKYPKRPRQEPPKLAGKPLSEIIIEQRGPL